MIKINSPKHWNVSRCCGSKFSETSADYASAAREVLQLKFIDDFFCKASLAGKKDIDVKKAEPLLTLPLMYYVI